MKTSEILFGSKTEVLPQFFYERTSMKTAIGFLIFLLIFLSLAACNKQEDLASKIKRLEYEAQKGKSDSQYELGRLYLHGKSIEKDLEKAAFWFSKACAQDNVNALGDFGMMYFHGDYVEQSYEKANELWKKGAALGNDFCLYNLGLNYEEGAGCEKNLEKAYEYFQKAAALGNTSAMYEASGIKLKLAMQRDDFVEYLYSQECKDDLKNNQKILIKFLDYKGLIESENPELQNYAANIYESESEDEKALYLYEVSAMAGNEIGLLNAAQMLRDGIGCKKDPALALKIFKFLADEDNHYGLYETGCQYLNGEGVTKNLEKAIFYLGKAAEKNCQMANATLGEFYLQHNFLYENSDLAKQYLLKAIELGSSNALNLYNQYFKQKYEGAFKEQEDGIPIQEHTKQLAVELAAYIRLQ